MACVVLHLVYGAICMVHIEVVDKSSYGYGSCYNGSNALENALTGAGVDVGVEGFF